MLVRSLVHEGTCISEQCSVDTGGDLWRDLHARLACQTVHHLTGSDRLRINPIHVGKGPSTYMVIDADQETVLESIKTCTLNAVTLEDDSGFAISLHSL